MRHAEKCHVTRLYESLRDSPLLRPVTKIRLGMDKLAEGSEANRIVMYPASGDFVDPERGPRIAAEGPPLCQLNLEIKVHIWAESYDHAWDLQRRLFQALHRATAQGGPLFNHLRYEDTADPDTSSQGASIVLRFGLKLPIERVDERAAVLEQVELETVSVDQLGVEHVGPSLTITADDEG